MIYHTVLFKWKNGTDPGKINEILRELNALKPKIPAILELQAGENFSDRSGGFTHVLVSKFLTRENLDQYQVHPDHQKIVVNLIRPVLDQLVVGDFSV